MIIVNSYDIWVDGFVRFVCICVRKIEYHACEERKNNETHSINLIEYCILDEKKKTLKNMDGKIL